MPTLWSLTNNACESVTRTVDRSAGVLESYAHERDPVTRLDGTERVVRRRPVEGPRGIESLRPGDRVVGYDGEPVRVLMTQAYAEDREAVFLRIELSGGAVVDACDMHRVAGVRAKNLKLGDEIAGRTVERISAYGGVERSYDLLTGDAGYRIAGVPVNSMIEELIATARTGEVPDGD